MHHHLGEAIRAFTLSFGDTNEPLQKAWGADPDWPMSEIMQAGLMALSDNARQLAKGRELAAQIDTSRLSELERQRAGRIDATTFAAERHQVFMATTLALYPSEAILKTPAA